VGEDREKVMPEAEEREVIRGDDEVEAHHLGTDEREAIRGGDDDDVEGHALMPDKSDALREQSDALRENLQD
jgi:hypothetical protein